MANVLITIKIMPTTPEVDLEALKEKVLGPIKVFSEEKDINNFKIEIEPIAFGIKSLNITFIADEAKGGTDNLEGEIRKIQGVNSAETIDVRRTLG